MSSEKKNNEILSAIIRLCFLHNNSTNQILTKLINDYPNLNEFHDMKNNIKVVNTCLMELNHRIKALAQNEGCPGSDHS